MPAQVRLGDISTSDPCGAPPRANNQGCANTFANGIAVHCKTMTWIPHSCPKESPHDATTTGGSPKTFSEGKANARVGDTISCGSTCSTGSPNVFIN